MVGIESESAILMFHIESAIPSVLKSDIHWYYTASIIAGNPDLMDITNSSSRTSTSVLTFSEDLLTLNISNIVQSGEETDAGRYFLGASNPAGDSRNFIDLVINGEFSSYLICHFYFMLNQVPLRFWEVLKISLWSMMEVVLRLNA